MSTIRTLKVSQNEPDTNSIWLYKGTMKYFNNGVWTTIGGSGNGEGGNHDVNDNILEVSITEDQYVNILGGNSETVNIEGINSDYEAIMLKIGEYSYYLDKNIKTNGTAMYTVKILMNERGVPTLNQIQAIVSPGVVSFTGEYIDITPKIVNLEIGDSESVKTYNLEQLVSGFFFTKLDYGYGVGTWQPSTGGFANVTTAYGNEVFYDINIDGSIVKNEEYIKPNEPYTIQLESTQIGTPLDAITASHVSKCGEIIIDGPTGPVTYTRSVDSTSSAVYFTSNKKNGTLQVLTYNIANSTLTASVVDQECTLPAATKTSLGGVMAGTNIADLAADTDLATVIGTVNGLLAQLRASGVLIS